MLLFLTVSLAATIHRLMYSYAPTNVLVRHLRTRRGPIWAIPTALVLLPTYLFAASLATALIEGGGPGWLNLVVLTCIWNAMKFAWMVPCSAVLLCRNRITRAQA